MVVGGGRGQKRVEGRGDIRTPTRGRGMEEGGSKESVGGGGINNI